MSRLIDADALRELFAETISAIANRPEMDGNLEYMIRSSAMAIKMIDDQMTVDAVTVVRCKNCKYGEIDDPNFPNQYFCHAHGCDWNEGDHFCSNGEKVTE